MSKLRISYIVPERTDPAGLGANVTRNHIISFKTMAAYSIVSMVYLFKYNENEVLKQQFLTFLNNVNQMGNLNQPNHFAEFARKFILVSGAAATEVNVNLGDADIWNRIAVMCWADVNLFTGPRSCQRADDPGMSLDKIPRGLLIRRSMGVAALKAAWVKAVGDKSVNLPAGESITIEIKNRESNLEGFVVAFMAYLNIPGAGCYRTKYSEWLIKARDGRLYRFNYKNLADRKYESEIQRDQFRYVLSDGSPTVVQDKVVYLDSADRGLSLRDGDCLKGVIKNYSGPEQLDDVSVY